MRVRRPASRSVRGARRRRRTEFLRRAISVSGGAARIVAAGQPPSRNSHQLPPDCSGARSPVAPTRGGTAISDARSPTSRVLWYRILWYALHEKRTHEGQWRGAFKGSAQ